MTGVGTSYRVRVTLAQSDRSSLLSIVSTLHRRGVEIHSAELAPSGDGWTTFTAVFAATPSQASTAAASLRNLIDVIGAELSNSCGAAQPQTGGRRRLLPPA